MEGVHVVRLFILKYRAHILKTFTSGRNSPTCQQPSLEILFIPHLCELSLSSGSWISTATFPTTRSGWPLGHSLYRALRWRHHHW